MGTADKPRLASRPQRLGQRQPVAQSAKDQFVHGYNNPYSQISLHFIGIAKAAPLSPRVCLSLNYFRGFVVWF